MPSSALSEWFGTVACVLMGGMTLWWWLQFGGYFAETIGIGLAVWEIVDRREHLHVEWIRASLDVPCSVFFAHAGSVPFSESVLGMPRCSRCR